MQHRQYFIAHMHPRQGMADADAVADECNRSLCANGCERANAERELAGIPEALRQAYGFYIDYLTVESE